MRPYFAAIQDEGDRLIARQMYLKELGKKLAILVEIEEEKPKLNALCEMNTSERSEMEIRK